jgi:anti-sigma regulatory factor (Ser/Thr protein kinase)
MAFAFREMLLNAMEHGGGFDANKIVEVTALRTRRAQIYHLRDPGPGFSPEALQHAAVSNPLDDPLAHIHTRVEQGMRPGGFGILLARQLVDELLFNERGNEVVLVKYLDPCQG